MSKILLGMIIKYFSGRELPIYYRVRYIRPGQMLHGMIYEQRLMGKVVIDRMLIIYDEPQISLYFSTIEPQTLVAYHEDHVCDEIKVTLAKFYGLSQDSYVIRPNMVTNFHLNRTFEVVGHKPTIYTRPNNQLIYSVLYNDSFPREDIDNPHISPSSRVF